MKIYDYAKELTKIAGKQVTANEIIHLMTLPIRSLRLMMMIFKHLTNCLTYEEN